MSSTSYAQEVVNLLENNQRCLYPHECYDQKLFKVIASRGTFADGQTKDLGVFGDELKSMVVVVDDRRDVWWKEVFNLIQVNAYEHYRYCSNYLVCYCNCCANLSYDSENSCCGLSDCEEDNTLFSLEELLDSIHRKFFDPIDNEYSDVRSILKSRVLEGCHIVFSGLIPLSIQANQSFIWRVAEEYGAQCYEEVSSHITHVIATKKQTPKVERAREILDVMIVDKSWLEESIQLFRRADELKHQIATFNKPSGDFNLSPCTFNAVEVPSLY
ncbi:RNA polymerase II C-terminal domain phosphatase [Acrasis kona]|uniref:protein-serine/threonine phosphatase n=1 Tax=Acrasis kona TaxID=1008807 RepID=A0AAW2ZQQ5_9EUKA